MNAALAATPDEPAPLTVAEKRELIALLEEKERRETRMRARTDLFFLLTELLGRTDMDDDWLRERCLEVQLHRDGYLDLWAREHYKSTIITFGLTIMEILGSHGDEPLPRYDGRELTFGIFSHTRPVAKGFLRQIKAEFEQNGRLKALFPDVLWSDPSQAPKWSEDDGIIVRRRTNPKEATVEAWGVVDGQPTGKHFLRLIYDDMVTEKSVTTPDMIAKTTHALGLSYNLGADGGAKRFVGTRYHFADTYREVIDRGTAQPRIYPATVDGTAGGTPVLMDAEVLATKRRDMGPYIFACQMLQNPKADGAQGFRDEWLRYYDNPNFASTNRYILVDPSSGRKKSSGDYTSVWVIGLGTDQNYYVIEMYRDRLNLTQRARLVMDLHRKHRPLEVRYEEYGMQADIEHIRTEQERQNYRFDVIGVGGGTAKPDRIKRLVPLFEQKRVYLPRSQHRTNVEGVTEDMVHVFIEHEYKAFPVSLHDDMLDALARIAEPELPLSWPQVGSSDCGLDNYTTDY